MPNAYLARPVRLRRVIKEAPDTKTFWLEGPLDFKPGQFLEISCFGIGEAPVSIASAPQEDFLKITFRRVGSVTTGLFNLGENSSLGIRGPFGNGFPLDQWEERDLIFIAGGIGAAPLRSLLKFILFQKKISFRRIFFLYGARSPQELFYKEELAYWGKSLRVLLTVDKPDARWKGRIGVVTHLLDEIKFAPDKTRAFLCGPALMLRLAAAKLLASGVPAVDIFLSLERQMQCGIGKCGHCYISDKFVCRDGPVFSYAQINSFAPREIL